MLKILSKYPQIAQNYIETSKISLNPAGPVSVPSLGVGVPFFEKYENAGWYQYQIWVVGLKHAEFLKICKKRLWVRIPPLVGAFSQAFSLNSSIGYSGAKLSERP